jgi:hypothetical protein
MNGKRAVYIFLVVCIALAILLLTKAISPMVGGLLFALALVVLGGSSQGFRRGRPRP